MPIRQTPVLHVNGTDVGLGSFPLALKLERVPEEGACWVGGTKWQGRVAMRVSISN